MSTEKTEEILSGMPFFDGLDPDFVKFLADCARSRQVEGNQALFRQGDPASQFFLLRTGSVSIEIPAIAGPTLQVQRLGPGKILGWSWLLPPYKWSFQARAEQDSEVLEFDGRAILERCEEDPRFGYELIKRFSGLMAERLDAAHRKMMDQWSPAGFA